jgi:uncharacterized protein (TIGR03437 family)
LIGLLLILASQAPSQRMAPTFADLQTFLDVCPQNDPYYTIFRRDFQILRNGVAAGPIACTEPYSKLPVNQVTEELTVLQTLRFAYYMDIGRSADLPWTSLRLYDWFRSRIAGINIDTNLSPGSVAASCCITIGGKLYITEATIANDLNRQYRQTADGLAAQVALIAHEVRHSEGNGYPHVSCCGIPGGCDQTYDENNLSAYAIQYYLAKQWLTGSLNLGYSCDSRQAATLGNAFASLANVYPSRFCDTKPPMLSVPAVPGGPCIPACTLMLSGAITSTVSGAGGPYSVGVAASTPTCGWAADSADAWISVTSSKNSSGNGMVTYSVATNQSGATRVGTLIVAGSKVPITQGTSQCTLSCLASVGSPVTAGAPAQFTGTATPTNCGPLQFDWDFGDGSSHSTAQNPSHTYQAPGSYGWTMTASSAPATCTQKGTVQVDSPVKITSVVSGAPDVTAIASGSWVTIYGNNLAETTRQWTSADFSGSFLPLSLDGVRVKIDGKDAAVYYVSPAQLNVQCPTDTSTGTVAVQVSNRLGSGVGTANLQTYAPAFFRFTDQYVAAVHADGVYVGKSDLFGGAVVARPATPGEVILLFGTGFGRTNPAVASGSLVTVVAPLFDPTKLHMQIGGQNVAVAFAGLVSPGLYQFNVTVPQLADGDQEVLADIGGASTPSRKFLTVQNQ